MCARDAPRQSAVLSPMPLGVFVQIVIELGQECVRTPHSWYDSDCKSTVAPQDARPCVAERLRWQFVSA